MFTKNELAKALASVGLRHDESIVIHSSASSIGETEGGIEGILDVFIDYFGKEGLCVFPTMTYTLLHSWDPDSGWCQSCKVPEKYCFAHGLSKTDVRRFHADMSACTGALPNHFLKRPGVSRSLSISSSVAAIGPGAIAFTSGHELCRTGCSKGSPWEKLLRRNGKILLLGVSVAEMTFLHGVLEWSFPEQCRMPQIPFSVEAYDLDGTRIETHEKYRVANISRLTPLVEQPLREGGAITDFLFGNAKCMLLDCRKTFETVTTFVQKNPSCL